MGKSFSNRDNQCLSYDLVYVTKIIEYTKLRTNLEFIPENYEKHQFIRQKTETK